MSHDGQIRRGTEDKKNGLTTTDTKYIDAYNEEKQQNIEKKKVQDRTSQS